MHRYIQLRMRPDVINQDHFGVCGMTSIVYQLLRHAPERADELFAATFVKLASRPAFQTNQHGARTIEFSQLARGYENHPGAVAAYLVDFCLSRALGSLFKSTAAVRYAQEKAQFNAFFAPLQDYRTFTRAGNLALRTHNLAHILHTIIGVQNLHITSNAAAAPAGGPALAPAVAAAGVSTFNNAPTLYARIQAHLSAPLVGALAGRSRVAFAAIFADLVPALPNPLPNPLPLAAGVQVPGMAHGTTLDNVYVAPASINVASAGDGNLAYNHWVVIEGLELTLGGMAQLMIWTWGHTYRFDVDVAHLTSYIRDVVFCVL